MKTVTNILIFKTNIRLKKDIVIIKRFLDSCSSIIKWTVDTSDIDNVLRVVSSANDPKIIIQTINQAGYHCEELAG